LKAERCAAPAGEARNLALGRPGAPPGGHYDPPARSWLIRDGQPSWKARPGIEKKPQVERREARVPIARDPERLASVQRATLARKGASQAPRASRRSAPLGSPRVKVEDGVRRAAKNRGGEALASVQTADASLLVHALPYHYY
jgi:hypothetical protein